MTQNLTFKQWLNGYYKTLPYAGSMAKAANWMNDPALSDLMQKADTIFGPTGSATWYDPVYSAEIQLEGLTRSNTIYALAPKTTFQQLGDSFKYIATDAATGFKGGIGENGVIVNGTSNYPTPTDVDNIFPAVTELDWLESTVGAALSAIQNEPVNNPAQIQRYMTNYFLDQINKQLAGVSVSTTVHGVDTPAVNGATSKAENECIDRWITNKTESGDTTHVSAAGDGDIFLNEAGSGTARVDRSAVTTWDAQIKLPTTPGTEEAYDILSELDDLMAVAKKYVQGTPNYIGLCSDKAMNKLQEELDPSGTWLEGQMEVSQTINGISTRQGVARNRSVPSVAISGVKVPFFTATHLDGTSASSWLWKNSVYNTGGVGNIYLINNDAWEYRTLIPMTYMKRPNTTNNSAPGLGDINVIYHAGQLIFHNWASHAALKYIAT